MSTRRAASRRRKESARAPCGPWFSFGSFARDQLVVTGGIHFSMTRHYDEQLDPPNGDSDPPDARGLQRAATPSRLSRSAAWLLLFRGSGGLWPRAFPSPRARRDWRSASRRPSCPAVAARRRPSPPTPGRRQSQLGRSAAAAFRKLFAADSRRHASDTHLLAAYASGAATKRARAIDVEPRFDLPRLFRPQEDAALLKA